jgi:hypothetical protein
MDPEGSKWGLANNIYLSDYQLYRLGHDKFDQISQSRKCGTKALGAEGQEIEKAKDRPSGMRKKRMKVLLLKPGKWGREELTRPK